MRCGYAARCEPSRKKIVDNFDLAAGAVNEALTQSRIGTPVAARVVMLLTVDHGRLEAALDRALDAVGKWMSSPATRLWAQGGVEKGQFHVQLGFGGGQTALVTVGNSGVNSPLLEVVVVGTRGTVAWEADGYERLGSEKATPENPAESSGRWMPFVRESLKTGQALVVTVGDKRTFHTQASSTSDARSKSPPLPSPVAIRPAAKPPYGMLLISGAYTHQEMYAKSFAEDKRCRLVGLTDTAEISPRRKELNARLAQALNIPLFENLDQALARDDVHIVSVCAEPERRGEIILRCAKAGKHVYLDKPLAVTMAEADAIVAALRQAGVVHQMFSLVHTATAARVRHAIESKQLGDLLAIHADVFFAKGIAGTAKLGQPRIESARPECFELPDSKRELFNVGVYPLVLLQWLLGLKPRRVFASTGNYFFAEHQTNDMEDFGQVSLEFEGGLIVSISAGRTGWRSHPMGGVNRTCLMGTKGSVSIDAFRPRLEVWADEEPWLAPDYFADDPMAMWASTQAPMGAKPKRAWITPADVASDARHFIDCVERGVASDVPADIGAVALEILLAAYRSAATGQVIDLPLARLSK
jgi:UDP-N-acetylglucosamine 3-dehydrogenase